MAGGTALAPSRRTVPPARHPQCDHRTAPRPLQLNHAPCSGCRRPFADGARFKSFVGLTPRASETGETDRKGQPMSKAGPSLLRATFVRARSRR
ncbi:MAG: transposase [Micromonosporaceae bacterium]